MDILHGSGMVEGKVNMLMQAVLFMSGLIGMGAPDEEADQDIDGPYLGDNLPFDVIEKIPDA
ncbi:MAG: hypothetical protein ABH885_04595 [Candidatus Omnitrophota bacterium]